MDKIQLKDYEDSNLFFNNFEKTIKDLKSRGGNSNEQEKLNYSLRTLPDSLSYVGDLINAMKEEDKNCEFITNKITMWENKNTSDSNKNKTSVFKVQKKKDVTYYGCDKPDHIKRNCKNLWQKKELVVTDKVVLVRTGKDVRIVKISSSSSSK